MSTTIEATCTTCGTINRVGETDVPAGTKFVSCASCKSRVALPPIKASRATPPPLPSIPTGGAGSAIGLADLPAPKRSSPLGGAEPSRPAPRSALSEADLPAPRGGRQQPPSSPPVTASGSFDLDDLLPSGGGAELPVPKGAGSARNVAHDVGDLPAPRASAPPVKSRAMTDLPLPDVSDLPAPAPPKPPAMRSAPTPPSVSDLPAPKAPGIVDLPAPRGAAGVSDLPAPVARNAGITDLPAPRAKQPGIVDLPTPKAAGGIVDLPAPRGGADVPAPKGFFDDLPQPARGGAPAKPDLPAPKGFFDDLPGRVSSSKPEVPAPKGFFDDLPGRVNAQKAAQAAEPEVPAPKGFFDDLPGRPVGNAPQPPAPKGFFDDLPQPASPTKASPPAAKPVNTPVELSFDGNSPGLDLGISPEPSVSKRFDDLDLSQPSSAGIKFDAPKPAEARSHTPSVQPLPAFQREKAQPATLELAEPRDVTHAQSQKLGPKQKAPAQPVDPDAARARAKRVRTMALAGLLVVALGGGGFYFYSKWAAKRAAQGQITEDLAKAKASLAQSDKLHWDRAAAAARLVLEEDPKHGEALAIGAEATLGSAFATGIGYAGKISTARGYIQRAVGESIAGPILIRAQALNAISLGAGDSAIKLLAPLAADPKDAVVQLYLGWAYAAFADLPNAIKAFDQAATAGTDYVKISAIYGRAQAKLEQADLEGATADFKAVYELDKEHIGAQVGLAAVYPASRSQEQEKELLALFERKDFASGDPRAQAKAYVLAAEAAKRGNRLDVARERYRKALEVMPEDLGALAGAADVELRDGKLDVAADTIGKALTISKDDIRAQLVQSEISIAKGELSDARARIDALARRNPAPPKLDQARIKMAAGRLADKESKDEDAAELYEAAAGLAGETDMAPTLAAVGKLTALADQAMNDGGDEAKAAGFKERAAKLLQQLEAQADKDPAIALSLGMAYLRTGDAPKAEPWLRKFVEARPDDAEGQFQLAKALARTDRTDDAITRLTRAIELAPKRAELAIELALTYERAGQDDKAGEIYTRLLTEQGDDASVELRVRAGRFYARRGEKKKAGEQGEAILKVAKGHTAGMFLKAEGLLEQNQLDEARLLFGRAAAAERDAMYFDGLGRAHEAKAATGETKAQGLALEAYKTATAIDDKLVNAHAGLGRMYMIRGDYDLAVGPLSKAYELKKDDPNVPFLIGLAYFYLKDKDPKLVGPAITWLKASAALAKNAETSYRLGLLHLEIDLKASAGYLDEAMELALRAERDNGLDWAKKNMPWLHDLLYKAGDVLNRTQNLKRAAYAWDAFIGHTPDPRRFQVQLREAQNALATGLAPYRKQ